MHLESYPVLLSTLPSDIRSPTFLGIPSARFRLDRRAAYPPIPGRVALTAKPCHDSMLLERSPHRAATTDDLRTANCPSSPLMHLPGPGTPLDDTTATAIVDHSPLSVASAYFTIYGCGSFRGPLDHIGRKRFLYRNPLRFGARALEEAKDTAFRLPDKDRPELTKALRKESIASAWATWIARKADIRTSTESNIIRRAIQYFPSANQGHWVLCTSRSRPNWLGRANTDQRTSALIA